MHYGHGPKGPQRDKMPDQFISARHIVQPFKTEVGAEAKPLLLQIKHDKTWKEHTLSNTPKITKRFNSFLDPS